MKKYYFNDGTTQQGPFTLEEMQAKNIMAETPVWYDGLADSTTAGKVEELKDLISHTPPPFHTPEAKPVEAKNYKKSELIFDIDTKYEAIDGKHDEENQVVRDVVELSQRVVPLVVAGVTLRAAEPPFDRPEVAAEKRVAHVFHVPQVVLAPVVVGEEGCVFAGADGWVPAVLG